MMLTRAHCPFSPTGSHSERTRLDVSTASTLRRNRARPEGDHERPMTVLVDCSAAIEKSSRPCGNIKAASAFVKALTRIRVVCHPSMPCDALLS